MNGPGRSTSRAPSAMLPLSYLVAAAAAFVLACVSVPALAGESYQPSQEPDPSEELDA